MLCRHYIRRPLIPALAASAAVGLKLLMTVAPASAQDADRTIPCASGMAGVYACDRVHLLGRLSREQLGAADTVKLNDVWGWPWPMPIRGGLPTTTAISTWATNWTKRGAGWTVSAP